MLADNNREPQDYKLKLEILFIFDQIYVLSTYNFNFKILNSEQTTGSLGRQSILCTAEFNNVKPVLLSN